MKARFIQTKSKGQSLPLIAVMMVLLVGVVGLSVDVGHTYAEQRSVVRGTNAAALAAMNKLLDNGTDSDVLQAIRQSLHANGIDVITPGTMPQDGDRILSALYIDSSGQIDSSCGEVGSCGNVRPTTAKYIQINVGGTVSTYFARLVGRNTLPVGATAYASRGYCDEGIYPIAVDQRYIDMENGGFKEPDGGYTNLEAGIRNAGWKRIYLRDNTYPSGAFSWLRWDPAKSGGSAVELADMFAPPGNIGDKFEEADWPSDEVPIQKPPVYPGQPGKLSTGDWLNGNPGLSNSNDVNNYIDMMIDNLTILNLPLYDYWAGGGNSDAAYHMVGMGRFLLMDFGKESGQGTTNQWYIDLVYIGGSKECATLVTGAQPTNNLIVAGQVSYVPRYVLDPTATDQPIQYMIVFDVSGSMSWTFDGKGWNYATGQAIQCSGATANCQGVANAWNVESERRIYQAKQALKNFVNRIDQNKLTRPDDMIRIVTFRGRLGVYPNNTGWVGDNQEAVTALSDVLPESWSNDKLALDTAINEAGMEGGSFYLTEGETPTAVGLARANQVFAGSPTTGTVTGKQYKRVVILVTDGIANVFRDGGLNLTGGSNCGSEIAICHMGYTDTGVARPITAEQNEATTLKSMLQTTNGEMFLVALGSVDENGLTGIASQEKNVISDPTGQDLSTILANIQDDVQNNTCVPAGGTTEVFTMQTQEIADNMGLNDPTVGTVTLTSSTGAEFPAAVQSDASSRRLSFQIINVPPGSYTMTAWVGYKGLDGISRKYNLITTMAGRGTTQLFQVQPSNTLGGVLNTTVKLDLDGSVCPGPGE